jgi:arylsulfatase
MFSSDNGPTYAGGADSHYFKSASPFQTVRDRIKGTVFEGGIRVPMIASWEGRIQPGSESDHISAFYDVFPTICAVAGIEIPGNIDGISFLPILEATGAQQKHEFLYWEFPSYGGQQAIRMGKWKAIRKNMMRGNMEIELYNMETDITEEINVASEYPEIIDKVERVFSSQHIPSPVDRFKFEVLGD